MIVFIIIAAVALLTAVFVVMPDLPATPELLISMQEAFNSILLNAIQFIRYFLSPQLTFVVVMVIAAMFASEPIYHGIMWILRKIPVLGIK